MSCINKSLPEYKELVSKYGDGIVEPMVRIMSINKGMADEFYIPTAEEASAYVKAIPNNVKKQFLKDVPKNTTPSRSRIISKILPLLEIRGNKIFVNTGLKQDVTDKVSSEIDVFIPSLNTLQSIRDEYPGLIQITDPVDGRSDRQVYILGSNEFSSDNNTLTYKGEEVDTYEEGNQKFVENLASNTKPTAQDETFYNIGEIDKKRTKINHRLKELLKRVLKQIQVVQVDDNGNLITDSKGNPILKPIDIITLEEYENSYSNRNKGERLDALGFADMVYGLLAATEEDGITFPEEALHFIIWALKDDPNFPKFWEMKDSKGIRLIEQTKVWKDNNRVYRDKYKNAPNTEEMVTFEIATKILAQYMYDYRRMYSPTNKILNLLYSIIEKFLKLFRSSFRFKRKELEFYPDALRNELRKIDEELGKFTYFKDHTGLKTVVLKNPSNIVLGVTTNIDKLKSVSNILKNLSKKYAALVSNAFQEGVHWTKFTDAFANSGITEYFSKEHLRVKYLKDLDLGKITKYINHLEKELQASPGNLDLTTKLYNIKIVADNFENYTRSFKDGAELISLEQRIAGIERNLKLGKIEEGFNIALFGRGNYRLVDYSKIKDYSITDHGIIGTMFKMAEKINILLENPTSIRIEHIHDAQQTLDSMMPIINAIKEHIEENDGNLFSDNKTKNEKARNQRVHEALSLIEEYATLLEDFVASNDTHYHAMNNLYMGEIDNGISPANNKRLERLVNRHTPKFFSDMSSYKYFTGFIQNIKEDWGKLFLKKIKVTNQQIKQNSFDEMNTLYQYLKGLGYEDLTRGQIKQIFFQLNSKGEHTGYLISKWDIASWEKSKKEYRNTIVSLLQKHVDNSKDPFMKSIYISNDYSDLSTLFAPISGLSSSDLKTLKKSKSAHDKKLLALWELKDQFGKLWKDWHTNNSEALNDTEIERIKNTRRQQLSEFHYKQWEYDNIKVRVNSQGIIETYYSGELLIPKKAKYPSRQWDTLNSIHPQAQKMAEAMNEFLLGKKLEAHPDKFSLEWYYRAPQIRGEAYDTIRDKNWFRKSWDSISSNFYYRSDDDFFHHNEDGKVLKYPPLRYNKMFDDPTLLSSDIIYSAAQYALNINARTAFLKILPELQGMVLSVEKGTVKKHRIFAEYRKTITGSGAESNLVKAMNYLLDSEVFGEKIIGFKGKDGLNKFFMGGKRYVTNRNLSYNITSSITSYFSSINDKIVSGLVGDIIDKESYARGVKEFTTQMPKMMKEFENPTKTTKIGILGQHIGIGNPPIDNFRRTNVSRSYRVVTSTVKPYSSWNAGEHLISMSNIPTVGSAIRNINGRWLDVSEAKRQGVYNTDDWKNAATLYDTLIIKDGKVDLNGIPPQVYDFFVLKVNYAVTQFSQVGSEEDRGIIQRHVLASYLAIHITYLFQTIDKMFKPGGYNWESGQYEIGYYTGSSLRYSLETFLALMLDLTKFFRGDFTLYNYKNMVDLSDTSNDVMKEAYVRNFHRISVQMAFVAALSALSYIIIGLAVGDGGGDDEEPKSLLLQLAALLTLKVRIEQGAKLSLTDLFDFAMKPLTNLDTALNRFQLLDSIYELMFEDPTEYEGKGVYKGMDKRMVNLIKTTPYVSQIFENYVGGIINSDAYGGAAATQAEQFSNKRDVLKTLILERSRYGNMARTFFDFLSLPPSILGYTMGEFLLYIGGSNYYRNDSAINNKLPTKKANEEQNTFVDY